MSAPRFLLGLFALLTWNAAAMQSVPGHIPAAAATARPAGALDPARQLDLAIELPLRHEDQLDALLRQIYDPANARHHHYLSVAQFTGQFGPSQADYDQVVAFARRNGLHITEQHANRLGLDVNASVNQIEKVFHLHLRQFQHPTEARLFYAPDVEPSLDLAIPVLHISGLDNFQRPIPGGRLGPSPIEQDPTRRPSATPQTGSGPSGSYFGSDFRNAYAPGVTLTGAGQSVALVEFDGYISNDIVNYENAAGISPVPLTNVLVGGFSGAAGSGEDDDFEVSLDIEMAAAMAPGLSRILVYETSTYGLASSMLNRIAGDNAAKQISCSWWFSSGSSVAQALKEFAAQGQSFFIISGDNDAFSALAPVFPPEDYNYTTVVGGTDLAMNGGAWSGETVWNFGNGTGSGGGVSSSAALPWWQKPVDMSTNGGSTVRRNIPDVAAVAQGIYVVSENGATTGGGYGTSFATPLWAAFAALANEQAAANGLPPLGFLNPALYQIGLSSLYTNAFHDIVAGNNFNTTSPDAFSAVPGYDLCTGWGSPTGANLINLLAPPPIALGPPTVASGQIEFTISNLQLGSTNYLQSSSDLTTWTSIATNYPGAPTITVATPTSTNAAAFFRVLQQP